MGIFDDLLIFGDWLEENSIKNTLYKLWLNNLRIKLRINKDNKSVYGCGNGVRCISDEEYVEIDGDGCGDGSDCGVGRGLGNVYGSGYGDGTGGGHQFLYGYWHGGGSGDGYHMVYETTVSSLQMGNATEYHGESGNGFSFDHPK